MGARIGLVDDHLTRSVPACCKAAAGHKLEPPFGEKPRHHGVLPDPGRVNRMRHATGGTAAALVQRPYLRAAPDPCARCRQAFRGQAGGFPQRDQRRLVERRAPIGIAGPVSRGRQQAQDRVSPGRFRVTVRRGRDCTGRVREYQKPRPGEDRHRHAQLKRDEHHAPELTRPRIGVVLALGPLLQRSVAPIQPRHRENAHRQHRNRNARHDQHDGPGRGPGEGGPRWRRRLHDKHRSHAHNCPQHECRRDPPQPPPPGSAHQPPGRRPQHHLDHPPSLPGQILRRNHSEQRRQHRDRRKQEQREARAGQAVEIGQFGTCGGQVRRGESGHVNGRRGLGPDDVEGIAAAAVEERRREQQTPPVRRNSLRRSGAMA